MREYARLFPGDDDGSDDDAATTYNSLRKGSFIYSIQTIERKCIRSAESEGRQTYISRKREHNQVEYAGEGERFRVPTVFSIARINRNM